VTCTHGDAGQRACSGRSPNACQRSVCACPF
jgi:hypothetical protein